MSLLDLCGRVRRASFLKNESEPLESSSFTTYLLQEEVSLLILIMGCGIHQTFHHLPKWKAEGAQQEREHRVRVPRDCHQVVEFLNKFVLKPVVEILIGCEASFVSEEGQLKAVGHSVRRVDFGIL